MDTEKRAELVRLYFRLQGATDSLHAQAAEAHEMARRIEDLTKDTTIRYVALRVRVEARAAFEQAKDLREALEQMGKEMRGEAIRSWSGFLRVPFQSAPPREDPVYQRGGAWLIIQEPTTEGELRA